MAKRGRPKPKPKSKSKSKPRTKSKGRLPEPGDVYAMRLEDGRFGAARVLRRAGAKEKAPKHVAAAATVYIGSTPPPLDHPDLRRLLVLNHHNWNDRLEILWIPGAPPADVFTLIGRIEPDEVERAIECSFWGGWESLTLQALLQWRWDHDREAVLAEDQAEREEEQRQLEESARQKREQLSRLTYASFRRQKLFEHWKDYPPKEMQAASRKIMKETAKKLEALGRKPDRRKARAILRDCILAFNRLDEENDHWIETTEREDICDVFYQLAHVAGFDDEPELADEWRDW